MRPARPTEQPENDASLAGQYSGARQLKKARWKIYVRYHRCRVWYRLAKDFLNRILGFVSVSKHPVTKTQDRLLILIDDVIKGRPVAIFC